MHGRLKVRTSAEEAAKKKKDQEIKLKAYRSASTKIFEKRKNGEYDQELMELTGKILMACPDVYTMWNIRKECILKFAETDKNIDIYDRDLSFSELCLQANPKSYNAWYHREWILENSPDPNWEREIELCAKYLKLDERNFHCWDYRRYVIKNTKVLPANELDFCTEKIQKNFSNYSSWHYRSKLLPILYPHESDKSRPISEQKLKDELELVLTAAFTDPNDSSAWFYQRWLLGYSDPQFDIAAFKYADNFALISFSKAINLNKDYNITTNLGAEICESKNWKPVCDSGNLSHVWVLSTKFKLFDDLKEVDFKLLAKEIVTGTEYSLDIQKKGQYWVGIKMPKFEYEFGTDVVEVLKEQLGHCNQLLEYEPDSKWTLLTAAILMRAIDRKQNHNKTLEIMEKLEKVDEMRKGYYEDLSSKWSIQHAIEKWSDEEKEDAFYAIDLSGLNLTSMFYENYLSIFYSINLSRNKLSNRNLEKFKYLQYCQCLNIMNNKITSLDPLPNMKSLGRFEFDNIEYEAEDMFKKSPNLGYISRNGMVLIRCFCEARPKPVPIPPPNEN